MENKTINDIIEKLEDNAIFKLSLSSDELFHSNFWHWLLIKYCYTKPEVVKIFYSDFGLNNVDRDLFKREKKHTDLSFEYDSKSVIIENKFKSYPTIEQLKKYAENQSNLDRIILISYVEPIFLTELTVIKDNLYKYNDEKLSFKIEYLSYKVLQKRLEKFVKTIETTSEDEIENKYIIKNYIKCLNLLNKIPEQVNLEPNKYNMYKIDLKAISDIYIKYRTAELAEFIEKNINHDVQISSGFNHKKGTINIIINDGAEDAKDYDLRIQIEKEQFRQCIVVYDKTKDFNELIKISGELCDKELWFYDTKKYRKEFCRYNNKDNIFVYRYCKIEEISNQNADNISYEKIVEYINKILENYIAHREEIKKVMNKFLNS